RASVAGPDPERQPQYDAESKQQQGHAIQVTMVEADPALDFELPECPHQFQQFILGANAMNSDRAVVDERFKTLVKGFQKRCKKKMSLQPDHNQFRSQSAVKACDCRGFAIRASSEKSAGLTQQELCGGVGAGLPVFEG